MNNNDNNKFEEIEVLEDNNKDSKELMLSIFAIAILVVAVLGITYAAFQYSRKGNETNTVKTGTMKMEYTEDGPYITIDNAMPVNDKVGKQITPAAGAAETGTDLEGGAGHIAPGANGVFDFTITTSMSGTQAISYEIVAIKQEIETSDSLGALENGEVKLYLTKDETGGDTYATEAMDAKNYTPIEKQSDLGAPEGAMILESGTITGNKTIKYRLRMWVDADYQIVGIPEQFKVKVNVYGKA